jgi:hypothetical protein
MVKGHDLRKMNVSAFIFPCISVKVVGLLSGRGRCEWGGWCEMKQRDTRLIIQYAACLFVAACLKDSKLLFIAWLLIWQFFTCCTAFCTCWHGWVVFWSACHFETIKLEWFVWPVG